MYVQIARLGDCKCQIYVKGSGLFGEITISHYLCIIKNRLNYESI